MAKNGNYIEKYPAPRNRVYEHRIVAAQMLRRNLKKEETVHHIDGNGFNNDPINLWVFKSNADHSRFHKTGIAIRQKDGTYIAGKKPKKPLPNICQICGNSARNKFCSRKCANMACRKAKRPPLDELLSLLQTNSYCAIGRMFGITDNAVRKWFPAYGIKPPKRYKRYGAGQISNYSAPVLQADSS